MDEMRVPTRDDLDLARRAGIGDPPSAADVVEVGNLLQAYALFIDHGCREGLASLFAPDATWDGTELGYGAATGAARIVDVVLGHHDPDRPMAHLPGPPLLVRTAEDHLETFSWCLATRLEQGRAKPVVFFSYDDELVRTHRGWRFQSRHLRLRFRGA
jgi:hypothetical protein